MKTNEIPSYVGHRKRLRTRAIQAPHSLPDYEILEIILFAGNIRGDVKPLAKTLIARFGSLAQVLNAQNEELLRIKGMNEAHLTHLKIVKEAASRFLKAPLLDKTVLGCLEEVVHYCTVTIGFAAVEQFRVLYLNSKNHLIEDECLATGDINQVQVYPRQIIKRALELHSNAIILLHNHPSGDATPSVEDKLLTQHIVQACRLMEIMVHDHIIVAQHHYYSFKANGEI
jgi:DNA repair protein RadC